MYEFLVIGPGIRQTWRRRLPSHEVIRLGRAPQTGWAVPWDLRISREHADLVLDQGVLRVRRLSTARNSIYLHGKPVDEFAIGPGEEFRIGQTLFRLTAASTGEAEAAPPVDAEPPPPAAATNAWLDLAAASERERLQRVLARLADDSTCLEAAPDAPPAADPPAAVPTSEFDGHAFGVYELTDQLYRSATCQVLKARHVYLDRWSAIQILASSAASAQAVALFHRKARLSAAFDHEHIVRTYDGGRIDGLHYRIMEYVAGPTLAERIIPQRISVQAAVRYIMQTARGLAYAHQQQVVHRDIQPAHLMLTPHNTIKIVGWGKARRSGPNSHGADHEDEPSRGTPGFMAPEQSVPDGHIDPRTDIYGLGCTLYALLASQATLPRDWQSATMSEEAGPNAPSLRQLRPETPQRIEAVYQRMLAHAPEDRWSSMPEVVAALENALALG